MDHSNALSFFLVVWNSNFAPFPKAGNGEGEAVAGLIALHYFYSTRAKRMAAAVLQLLDDNPRLHEVLSDMGKENGSLMPISGKFVSWNWN